VLGPSRRGEEPRAGGFGESVNDGDKGLAEFFEGRAHVGGPLPGLIVGDAAGPLEAGREGNPGPGANGEAATAAAHQPSTARHTNNATPSSGCINKLKQWRGLATRYDKTATSYLAALHLAATLTWSAR
jgi:hypothetical protein